MLPSFSAACAAAAESRAAERRSAWRANLPPSTAARFDLGTPRKPESLGNKEVSVAVYPASKRLR